MHFVITLYTLYRMHRIKTTFSMCPFTLHAIFSMQCTIPSIIFSLCFRVTLCKTISISLRRPFRLQSLSGKYHRINKYERNIYFKWYMYIKIFQNIYCLRLCNLNILVFFFFKCFSCHICRIDDIIFRAEIAHARTVKHHFFSKINKNHSQADQLGYCRRDRKS